MIRDAINKIVELAKIEQFEIDGRKYTSKGLVPVLTPTPAALVVHTLSGLVDYISKNIDALNEKKLVIHVADPLTVNLYGYLATDSFYERPEFVRAVFDPPRLEFGDYRSIESFVIALQSSFVDTETRASILKVVGNIKGEQVQQFSDDGVSQTVMAKAGVSTVAPVAVPNPVTLKPFRTFPEVDQPESMFIFRMRQQQGQAPGCGLWLADNKLWKIQAVKNIAAWLVERLSGVSIIA